MPPASTTRRADPSPLSKAGVLVLDGYGIRLAVERGHLVFSDGFGRQRRTGRLSRATSRPTRVVVLGHTGFASFEALRWLHDVGAAFVQLDSDGTVITVSAPPKLDDARVRRAQALATSSDTAMDIARVLLRDKLDGQASVLAGLPITSEASASVHAAVDALPSAASARELLLVEAAAAAAYWMGWSDVVVKFATKDVAHVPSHWLRFGTRASPLTSSPRKAVNPANAILNYLYALLEFECVIALRTLGLDPGMGVLHADTWARDSLALDLMEAVRPKVDAMVLDLLAKRVFAAKEFFETRGGDCRLVSPLPSTLAAYSEQMRRHVAPVAERVMRQFVPRAERKDGGTTKSRAGGVTPLTQANRSVSRAPYRNRAVRSAVPAVPVEQRCRDCGEAVEPGRFYCGTCVVPRERKHLEKLGRMGPAALAQLRTEGADPTATPEARARRSASRKEVWRLDREWDESHPERPDPEAFVREILPGLAGVSITAMAVATGLSESNCSLIRRGRIVPHPRHWSGLSEVGAQGRYREPRPSRLDKPRPPYLQ